MLEEIIKLLNYYNNSPSYKYIDYYINEGELALQECIIRGLELHIEQLEEIIENEISENRLDEMMP